MKAKVTNNRGQNRFESAMDGQTAQLRYEIEGSRIVLTHTNVPPAIEKRGVGTALVEAALSYARDHHLHVVPQCPFVAKYIAEHPEYQSLVDPAS